MKLKNLAKIQIIALIALIGCGSSGEDSFDYAGTWDVQVNLLGDDCSLFDEATTGFTDVHDIFVSSGGYELTSDAGLPTLATGSVSEGILNMTSEQLVDLFGDGSVCLLDEEVAYSDLTATDATVTYEFALECTNGFACLTYGLGSAVR
jgi:hypothetical protein